LNKEERAEKFKKLRELVSQKRNNPLAHMFEIQKDYVNLCFHENDMRDRDGKPLTCEKIADEFRQNLLQTRQLPNIWVKIMLDNIVKEAKEASDLMVDKYWSKEEIGEAAYPNLSQEERKVQLAIELVDIWHFLMETFIFIGFSPEMFYDMYIGKNKVNVQRQENKYNAAFKDENDNLELGKEFNAAH